MLGYRLTQAYDAESQAAEYTENNGTDKRNNPITACHDWQYVQDIITPDKENNDAGTITITHAAIAVAYDNNINKAYVDNVSLRLTQAQTYAYDAQGNVDTSVLTGAGTEVAEYNEETGDLTKYTAPNGIVFNYTSNTKHSITQEAGAGTVTDYIYNDNGYLTSTKLTAAPPEDTSTEADSRYMEIRSKPTGDKNFTESATDSAGNTTLYTYATDRLETATNAAGLTTTYTYNHMNDRPGCTYITGIAAVDYAYTKGQLTQLSRKTFPEKGAGQENAVYQTYNFTYNAWGQGTSVAVGEQTLVTHEYEDVNIAPTETTKGGGNKTKTTYGNGDSINFEYDAFDRLIKSVYNDTGEYVEYTYNGEGSLSKLVHRDSSGNVIASYEFERDNLGRLIRSRQVAGNNGTVQRTEHIYDTIGRISEQRWSVGGSNFSESYTYNDGETGNGALNTVTTATGDRILFAYDPLNRLDTTTVKQGGTTLYTTTYEYWAADAPEGETADPNRTSNEVKFQYTELANGTVIAGNQYVYDKLGNVTKLYESHPNPNYQYRRELVTYEYDDQSQLKSETYRTYTDSGPHNYTTVTWHYTYDTAGNILNQYKTTGGSSTTESEATEVRTYTYSTGDWKDLLMSVTYGDTTHTLVYDAIGNPTTYGNGEQLYTNLTWEHGRQLTRLTTGGNTYTYDYDIEGIRTLKVGDGEQHEYITQNGKVVREHITSYNSWDWVLDFIYDNAGRPFALKYSIDGGETFTTYYYILNFQGDVVALLNASGTVVARYTYNAWGELLSVTDDAGTAITNSLDISHINPLRYRGYYYDAETGFYYLQSRYYDPAICRFINADSFASTGQGFTGTNMFAYCGNNPVGRIDYTGQSWNDFWDFLRKAWAEASKAMEGASYAYAGCGGLAAADGPLPFGDIAGGIGAAFITFGVIGYSIYEAAQSESKAKEEEKVDALTGSQSQPTVIYRYGGTNPGNLTPREKDKWSGLSFSTIPMPGAAVTTIEALNATGVVYAVQDNATHVSVRPIGATMEDWISAGSSSVWTQAVKSVVVKWYGGN